MVENRLKAPILTEGEDVVSLRCNFILCILENMKAHYTDF